MTQAWPWVRFFVCPLYLFDLRGRNQMATLVVIFGLTPILGIFVSVLAGKLLTDD